MSNRGYVRRLINAIYYLDGLYVQGGKLSGVEGNMTVFLYALDDGKVHTQKSLQEEWMLPRTTLNTIVKRCEKEGYLTLERVPGTRREKALCLTEKGKAYTKEVLADIYAVEEEAITETLKECSPDFVSEFELFVSKLDKYFKIHEDDRQSEKKL